MNITIVEDEPIIRSELDKTLREAGYETTLVDDFRNVYDSLLKETTDLILLDVNLPYMDGFELCKKIKNHKNVPVIFLTSRSATEDELKSIQVGDTTTTFTDKSSQIDINGTTYNTGTINFDENILKEKYKIKIKIF